MDATHLNKCNYGVFIVTLSASASTAHPQTETSMEFKLEDTTGTPRASVLLALLSAHTDRLPDPV